MVSVLISAKISVLVLGKISVWAILTDIGIGMPRQFGFGIGSTQTDTSVVTVLSKFLGWIFLRSETGFNWIFLVQLFGLDLVDGSD